MTVGCHQLTPQPVATYSQPPISSYPSGTPSYVSPTPDPAYGSPTPADPYGASRPVTPTTPEVAQPSLSGRPEESYNRRVPTPVEPPADSSSPTDSFVGPVLTPPTDIPESESEDELPSLIPESSRSDTNSGLYGRATPPAKSRPANLELSIRVSANHQVGAAIEYQLEVKNSGELTAKTVTIEASFDNALIFPGRTDKRVRKVLGDYSGGQTQSFPLTLTSNEAGVHCARFTLSGTDLAPITKQVCVTVSKQSTARRP
ncbi:hypothetical protein [Thalassoroseus pseudoceratinae]|uniref:hypothetical protein n=1 Tax=Thalassoroseus pseudoceratinae TaxID=2713176 RepID=UPI00141E53BF|nr:hypothetical protein [Thalassoroseus pseudoceratinae]